MTGACDRCASRALCEPHAKSRGRRERNAAKTTSIDSECLDFRKRDTIWRWTPAGQGSRTNERTTTLRCQRSGLAFAAFRTCSLIASSDTPPPGLPGKQYRRTLSPRRAHPPDRVSATDDLERLHLCLHAPPLRLPGLHLVPVPADSSEPRTPKGGT